MATLSGTDGNDIIFGQDGSDTLYGGDGDDWLVGGAGSDVLTGQNGNDLLEGGEGADVLFGGTGINRLYGGDGNDRFVIDQMLPGSIVSGGEGFDQVQWGDASFPSRFPETSIDLGSGPIKSVAVMMIG